MIQVTIFNTKVKLHLWRKSEKLVTRILDAQILNIIQRIKILKGATC